MDRRTFLASTATSLLYGSSSILSTSFPAFAQVETPPETAESPARSDEPPQPFSFDILTQRMRELAGKAFEEPKVELPEVIANLSYDEHRAIRFRPDHAVWKGLAPFELQAFHMGWLFKQPVRIHSIHEGKEKTLVFEGSDFEYRKPLDPAKFQDLKMPGTAGFRLHYPINRPYIMDELIVFLGASYFRAVGMGNVYGLSARGLAVNTATSGGEEFPRFTDFYIVAPTRLSRDITVYAALDSQSVTGAYEFKITPGQNTVMDVSLRLFVRQDIERLGIAPMTSMFLFAENNHSAFDDYRGQVHDSDGLKIIRSDGEEMWRNLNNPKQLAQSFLGEENPKAFGLFQRDRNFENYQDAGAAYERRPSLLVEPIGKWGKGSINLVEIPTELEVNDNIVAFWIPDTDIKAGQELEFKYRLTWGAIKESTTKLARVTALRSGAGGVSGVENDKSLRKFVVDFEGEVLRNLTQDSGVEATVNVSNGEIVHSTVSRVDANGAWRLVIDLKAKGKGPVEMKAHLNRDGQALSETWLYQWREGDADPS